MNCTEEILVLASCHVPVLSGQRLKSICLTTARHWELDHPPRRTTGRVEKRACILHPLSMLQLSGAYCRIASSTCFHEGWPSKPEAGVRSPKFTLHPMTRPDTGQGTDWICDLPIALTWGFLLVCMLPILHVKMGACFSPGCVGAPTSTSS